MTAFKNILIWLATMIIVVIAFIAYNKLSDTPDIQPDRKSTKKTTDISLPDELKRPSEIGEVSPGPMYMTKFTDFDPDTKELRRILGFRRLLEGSDRESTSWNLEKPYMKVFTDSFRCQIYSDQGNVEVEKSGGRVSPRDAQLSKNVQIHIQSKDPDDPSGCSMYMEDLNYSSERSEFSTTGPVKLVSAEAELVGKGMILIYNAAKARIELLRIDKLEYMRLRNIVKPEDETPEPDANADISETASANKDAGQDTEKQNMDTAGVQEPAEITQQAPGDQLPPEYYQCKLLKNVEIRYGNQIRVSGADEVFISNILWSKRPSKKDDQAPEEDPSKEAPALAAEGDKPETPEPDNEGDTNRVAQDTAVNEEDLPKYEYTDNDELDVIVTCDGQVIILPMPMTDKQVSEKYVPDRLVRFTGQSVDINELDRDTFKDKQILARCGSLLYNFDSEILDLYTNRSLKQITLAMSGEKAELKTNGRIQWRRRDCQARIEGPGTMSIKHEGPDQEDHKTQLAFEGTMDLFFVNDPEIDKGESLVLKSANLAGGMDALIRRDHDSKIIARDGQFEFDKSNNLVKADLKGSVTFETDSGALDSSVANITFGQDNRIESAEMTGDVLFKSDDEQAVADKAIISFDESNRPESADMIGSVEFTSPSGSLSTERSKILFAKNDVGQSIATRMVSMGSAVMEQGKTEKQKLPARFHAKKIDYNLVTGNAYAHGPVKFTFYTDPDPNNPAAELVPVQVTASGHAEFFSSENKIVFFEEVLGIREVQDASVVQKDSISGDKLVVDLLSVEVKDERLTRINGITVTGKSVKLESIKYEGNKTISHVRLRGRDFHYDAVNEIIKASGPGDIQLNNANVPAPEVKEGRHSLAGPCYALMRGFGMLTWDVKQGMFHVVESKEESINIGYQPISGGVLDKKIYVGASDCKAWFEKTVDKRNRLVSLFAEGGVYFEQEGGNLYFGEKMNYDNTTSLMMFESGGPNEDCILNGVLVPRIEVNMETEEVKTELSTSPGAVPMLK